MPNQRSQKKKPLNDSFWNYFLKLESDFHTTAQYLGGSRINDTACSIEFAQQLVCICTECEGITKKLCKAIDRKSPAANMGHYKHTIMKRFPKITTAQVRADPFQCTIKPFSGWEVSGGRLEWWNAFQDIKHHRDANFEKANLKNTLEALGALLVLELYLYAMFSPEGAQTLGGAKLLWAPGMPQTEPVPASEFLPHLPLKNRE